jgi:hypothetical protein
VSEALSVGLAGIARDLEVLFPEMMLSANAAWSLTETDRQKRALTEPPFLFMMRDYYVSA